MKNRYKTERQSNPKAFELLGRNPSEHSVHEAIKQLEDCVKNGLIYHACELSDWISFVAQEKLKTNKELGQRFRIERLKRLGYLNFFEQERICRDDLCESEDLNKLLNADESTELDNTRFILYTAIGHTLWHENDIKIFNEYFEYYKILFTQVFEK